MQWNAEGVSTKKIPLSERLYHETIDVACLQETHLKESQRFTMRGYQVFRHDREGRSKGGVAILVKNSIPAQEFVVRTNNQAEIHGVNIIVDNQKLRIFSVYCPPDRDLSLELIQIQDSRCLIVGDFNSHSEAWGYDEADRRGEEVEDWQIDNGLVLLNDPDDPPTFFSRRWLTSSTPDLAFATNDISRIATRTVLKQLGGSDHRPVKISLDLHFKPQEAKTFPRWNYKKANWERFSSLVDQYSLKISNKQQNLNTKIKALNQVILKAAQESIPRGARKNYKPYWTEELQQEEDAVAEARDRVEEDPSQENNITLKAATARHRRTFIQEARRTWQEKTEQLNMDKEGNKLWNLARALNDENSRRSPITLEQDGELCTGKQAANVFAKQYAQTSDLQIPTDRRREVREAQRARRDLPEEPLMTAPFVRDELEDALKTLKLKKAPGPDNITNEMLMHLGPKAKKKLLQLFNDGWRSGTVPQIWREAIMIPVHKKGKDKSKAESYRPISLTSCVGKLMERLINARLMWHLEAKHHITPEQAAFRQDRSTEDQVTYISQAIEDAFQEKKHTLAVWIDMEKAFDKVWKEGLKMKLRQCGVAGRMYRWIGQYLHNRKAKVQVKQHFSKKKILRQGVPQGGVLSPTLFLIFIGDILQRLPRNVRGAIYADDLALWCSEEYITTANYRLQQALQEIEAWSHTWLIKVNERKTTYTVFSLSKQQQRVSLQLNGRGLQEEESPTYLGVTLDRRLTWKSQLQKNQTRAKIRLALMKKLSGTQWGADQKVLKKLYIGRIRPVLEYGMAASSTAAKTNMEKLSRVQNQAMRMMTGAMRTTPISAMETVIGLQSLEDRRDIKVLTQAAKYKRLQEHPMCQRMNQPTKGRLKRSSFIHHSRMLERENPELLHHMPKAIPPVSTVPPWNRAPFPTICTNIPGIGNKSSQLDPERKSLTLELISSKYPRAKWTHAFTDGSATEATRDGGAGVFIKYSDEEARIKIATGKYSTNFKAETEALRTAATEIAANLPRTKPNIVIFTDALSVLDALQNPQQKELNELKAALVDLAAQTVLTLQWIPAHCGIHGNETADRLAREGGQLEQENKQVSFSEEKTVIKTIYKKKWKQQHPDHNQSDSYQLLSRSDQVTLFRLRTGHTRLNAHMYRKLHIGHSEMCPCDTAPMTTDHLLQDCPLHDEPRQAAWPQPVSMRDKLYGDLEALRRTAAFVRATGVPI